MENLEKPQVISGPFAYNGQKNTIPDAPTGDAHASVQEGFPPVTMIALDEGGEAPYGQDFNGLGNLLSQFYFFKQNGGMHTFEPEVSQIIGGYPENAMLWYFPENTPAKWLRSTKPNNTDNFITNPDVIGTSWVEAATNASLGAVGSLFYTSRTSAPAGCSFCDGSTKTRAEFPAVWEMLTGGDLQVLPIAEYESKLASDGVCGYFGIDTAAETFRVPTLKDVYIKAGDTTPEFNSESLPNITGTVVGGRAGSPSVSGAFSNDGSDTAAARFDGGNDQDTLFGKSSFDASRSSSVYQNNAKVNPDYIVYRLCIILATEFKEISIEDYTAQIEEATTQAVKNVEQAGVEAANKAKDWATKTDGTVDGNEYSSKYYANQAAETAASLNPEDLVHKTGNETISGQKIFKNAVPRTIPVAETSGTISLQVSGVYSITITGATTFQLPQNPGANVLNQILVQMSVTGTPSIAWGTAKFFNKATPEIEAGDYDVVFEYDNVKTAWVCGVLPKGAAE